MKKIYLLVIIFLIIGAYMIKSNLDVDFKEKSDRRNFLRTFAGWVYNVGINIKDLAGYAVKQDWLPDKDNINTTNSTKND